MSSCATLNETLTTKIIYTAKWDPPTPPGKVVYIYFSFESVI